tara:strand:+ start:616 stop:798 length:183 start_codon:yes stop_codon:yes gene_type:complete
MNPISMPYLKLPQEMYASILSGWLGLMDAAYEAGPKSYTPSPKYAGEIVSVSGQFSQPHT